MLWSLLGSKLSCEHSFTSFPRQEGTGGSWGKVKVCLGAQAELCLGQQYLVTICFTPMGTRHSGTGAAASSGCNLGFL